MAATQMATQISRFHSSIPTFQPSPKTASFRRVSLVRASSEPQRPGPDAANLKPPFLSQDLSYLVKLGAGSVAGAAAIKYGSILFPETTQPNLGLALLVIFAPVVVAVLILIKQSRVSTE
ncbi:hypothetical protein CASFOL_001324 [Castilleja foliolosa]|uniref:Uncharacterized protein n=1 Tax=Castilleja foliolosa TaxID=1961234 RepID=A0ABD3DF82_9LAMI